MGALCSKKQKLINKEQQKLNSQQEEPSIPPHIEQKKIISAKRKTPQQTYQKQELVLKKISKNKKMAIDKSPIITKFIHSQEWIINSELLYHFRVFNAFSNIQMSPALALELTLDQKTAHLINKDVQMHKQEEQKTQFLQGDQQYILYPDIFRIKFFNLLKLKIKSIPHQYGDFVTSLQAACHLKAPFLQQFAADGHPITNARFLRRCHWPQLKKISLKGNFIANSFQLGQSLASLNNSCHIESIDISGHYSQHWTQISWILKLGFADAQQEYIDEDGARRLIRIDGSLLKNRFRREHLKMIRGKFNNSYFENPLIIW